MADTQTGGMYDQDTLAQLQAMLQGSGGDGNGLLALQQLFAPSAQDKHNAITQGLLQFGANTLAAKGVNAWQAIGQGASAGLGSWNNDIKAAQQQRAQNMGLSLQLQQMLRAQQGSKALAGMFADDPTNQGSAPAPVPDVPGVSPKTAAQFGPASSADNSGMDASLPPTPMVPGAQPPQTSVGGVPITASNWKAQMPPGVKRLLIAGNDPKAAIDAIEKYGATQRGPDGTVTAHNGQPLYKQTDAGIQYFNPDGTPGAFQAFDPGNNAAAAARAAQTAGATSAATASAQAPYDLVDIPLGNSGQTVKVPKSVALARMNGSAPAPAAVGGVALSGAPPGATTVGGVPIGGDQFGVSQSPAAKEFQTKQAAALSDYATELGTNASNAGDVQGKISYIQKISPYARFGASTPTMQAIAQNAMDLPFVGETGIGDTVANWAVPNAKEAVPALQDWNKQVIQLGTAATKALGSREAAQIFEKQMGAQPNPAMTQKGAQLVMDSMHQQAQVAIDKLKAFNAYQADPSIPAAQKSVQGFEQQWNAQRPPATYLPSTEDIQRIFNGKDPVNGLAHPVQGQKADSSSQQSAPPAAKTVVRTGKLGNRSVVQYSDGTTAYQ